VSTRIRSPGITRAVLLGTLLGVDLRSALGVVEELVSMPNLPVHVAEDLNRLHHALADWSAKALELNAALEAGR
jgi:hypothetical protein